MSKKKRFDKSSGINSKKYTPRGSSPAIKDPVVVNAHSGEAKFIRGGRRKERSLDSMESREDIRLRNELFRLWKLGKLK